MQITHCNMTWKELCLAGLNHPGLLVTTADGRTLLVGNVNTDGGSCGCCGELRDEDVITSYAVVWREK